MNAFHFLLLWCQIYNLRRLCLWLLWLVQQQANLDLSICDIAKAVTSTSSLGNFVTSFFSWSLVCSVNKSSPSCLEISLHFSKVVRYVSLCPFFDDLISSFISLLALGSYKHDLGRPLHHTWLSLTQLTASFLRICFLSCGLSTWLLMMKCILQQASRLKMALSTYRASSILVDAWLVVCLIVTTLGMERVFNICIHVQAERRKFSTTFLSSLLNVKVDRDGIFHLVSQVAAERALDTLEVAVCRCTFCSSAWWVSADTFFVSTGLHFLY